ncbi:MAG: hypothetical protein Q4E24_04855 [bacterium]|nr:hypothetical protein [bacterium]
MHKTMRQMLWENQAAKSSSMEELFLLWEMMQREEEGMPSDTGYEEIDAGCFHLDGVIDEEQFSGVLYILKEPSMKKRLQNGELMPMVVDMRRYFREYRRGSRDERGYVAGMQQILLGDGRSAMQALHTAAILYLNKRGGKEISDSVYLNYADAYKECIVRQIHLIAPRVIVCGGEDIFRWVVKEVFSNKKKNKNQKEYMLWKNRAENYLFTADENYRYTDREDKVAVTVINMWNPAYRVNKEQYLSLEDYLEEFSRRISSL